MVRQGTPTDPSHPRVVVLICADAEWQAVRRSYPQAAVDLSPFGEWLLERMEQKEGGEYPVIFFQAGWGKIAAAASTQYVIDRWRPELIANLGTCGGFAGEIAEGEVILVEKTVVYDLLEKMGDPAAHLAHYTTQLDPSWAGEDYPIDVVKATMVSGDRDIVPEEIPFLKAKFGARAGDWESAAIAWVADKNKQRCLILRGVSDVVDDGGSPAYAEKGYFEEAVQRLMPRLISSLPDWISLALRGDDI